MAIATASLDFDRFTRPSQLPALTPELTALEGCPLFADASSSALQALASLASLSSCARGAIVATEGAPPSAVVLGAKGRLRAVRRAASGRESPVEVFRPGGLL